ncbi:hypothetical protein GGI15_003275 [Coemansia interrupta]|uniref:Hydrolase of the HAD superfamily n=1 Tax=Coemansia interrupta TaxID=1126814 RepID=A0A9W8HGR2_9FUNG|nr:hypothetical protein GGI15_003275 [Coemansia interrupta]
MAPGRKDNVRAVIFDIGGVVVRSPFLAISAYERESGLPANYINVALSKLGDDGAFQQYERGEISHSDFIDRWTAELNDTAANNQAYRAYLERRSLDVHMVLPSRTRINGAVLFRRMMDVARQPNEAVVELIRWLRQRGYRVAALTNNFSGDATDDMRGELFDELFDHFVESTKVGLRKPDPRFYLHACNLLEVRPTEAVFLDDIGKNLRAADRLGMAAVQVEIGREAEAVEAVKRIIRARGAPARL